MYGVSLNTNVCDKKSMAAAATRIKCGQCRCYYKEWDNSDNACQYHGECRLLPEYSLNVPYCFLCESLADVSSGCCRGRHTPLMSRAVSSMEVPSPMKLIRNDNDNDSGSVDDNIDWKTIRSPSISQLLSVLELHDSVIIRPLLSVLRLYHIIMNWQCFPLSILALLMCSYYALYLHHLPISILIVCLLYVLWNRFYVGSISRKRDPALGHVTSTVNTASDTTKMTAEQRWVQDLSKGFMKTLKSYIHLLLCRKSHSSYWLTNCLVLSVIVLVLIPLRLLMLSVVLYVFSWPYRRLWILWMIKIRDRFDSSVNENTVTPPHCHSDNSSEIDKDDTALTADPVVCSPQRIRPQLAVVQSAEDNNIREKGRRIVSQIKYEVNLKKAEFKESCSKCSASFSNLLVTRYACNNCGAGYCNKCCNQRVFRHALGATSPASFHESVRVCDDCYELLTKNSDLSFEECNFDQGCRLRNKSQEDIYREKGSLDILTSTNQ